MLANKTGGDIQCVTCGIQADIPLKHVVHALIDIQLHFTALLSQLRR